MQKTIIKLLILTIVLSAALSASYLFAVWTGPTQSPPLGNTLPPINIGNINQVKDAGLSVNALTVFGASYFDGNVGIKEITPATGGEQNLALDVEGAIGAKYYCDEKGNNCVAGNSLGSGGGSGVDKIIAGSNVTVSPSSGVGSVTVSSKGNITGYQIVHSYSLGSRSYGVGSPSSASVSCPIGKKVAGGGCLGAGGNMQVISSSYPSSDTTWTCEIFSQMDNYYEYVTANAYAICIDAN